MLSVVVNSFYYGKASGKAFPSINNFSYLPFMAENENFPEAQQYAENNGPISDSGPSVATNDDPAQSIDLTPKPEPIMEVHHHPDLHHRKKYLKEYFLEFLMIFLAVTLGFFAENLREYFTDRTKEKEYMHGMINDLKADTSFFNHVIFLNDMQRKGCDSLADLLANKPLSDENVTTAYALYLKYTRDYYNIAFQTGTYSQLANNGFRLISNTEVIREIANYHGWATLINSMEADLRHWHSAVIDNGGKKIFDNRFLRKLQDSFYTSSYDAVSIPPLLTYPTEKIVFSITANEHVKLLANYGNNFSDLINDLGVYRSYLILYNTNIEISKESAKKLIYLIDTTYQLE